MRIVCFSKTAPRWRKRLLVLLGTFATLGQAAETSTPRFVLQGSVQSAPQAGDGRFALAATLTVTEAASTNGARFQIKSTNVPAEACAATTDAVFRNSFE